MTDDKSACACGHCNGDGAHVIESSRCSKCGHEDCQHWRGACALCVKGQPCVVEILVAPAPDKGAGDGPEQVERLTRERDEAVRALDPKYLRAAEYLLRNADKHPNACCPECAANGARADALQAEVAELRRWKGAHKDNAGKLVDAEARVAHLLKEIEELRRERG